MTVVLKVRFPVDDAALSSLHQRAFSPDRPATEAAIRPWAERLDRHSLTWIGAFSEGRLVGFVHAVWDGGTHAFILDTAVHPDFQRLGIGRDLVRTVTDEAFKAGCDWVHVDYEPEFASFYESACGFRPTPAGLRSARLPQPLRSLSATPTTPLGDVDGVADRSGVLLAGQLLAQDVGVTAVLGKLAQHVQVHPAQRERAAPVAEEQVVQP
jgi:GNAT superfamily N-acetyltransferase